jgi:leader peptidase (prepilin peptidase)/N-methyltransferase
VRLFGSAGGLAFIDWDTTLLPDDITLPLLWAGLLASAGHWIDVPLLASVTGPQRGTCPVAGLLGLQAGDRQGRHGLRRLQAVCRPGRLVRLAGAGSDHLDVFCHWRTGRIGLKVFNNLREGGYVPFGPFLVGAGLTAMVFGPNAILQTVLNLFGL